jgi:Bifunctional DNA primase/polymerase, N-terminal
VKWGEFQKKLPTINQLRRRQRAFSPDRWGIVTGAVSKVVDFDGEQGPEWLQKWDLTQHVLSGGAHVYFQHPGWRVPTLNAKSSKNTWPWPGVDVRADGDFAVLLGSNDNGN